MNMLNENIKNIRKKRGFTQEELANRLHITRQTISKWEKGYSVPDAEMLSKMADVFDVSVSELLAIEKSELEQSEAIADHLAGINEQLAIKNRRARRIWKAAMILFIVLVIIPIVIEIVLAIAFMLVGKGLEGAETGFNGSTEWICTLNGKEYAYSVQYDDDYRIVSHSGDDFVSEHIDFSDCTDANRLAKRLEDYFNKEGGKIQLSEVKGLPLKAYEANCEIPFIRNSEVSF